MKVAHALEDPTVSLDIIRRRANAPVANVAKSMHDDYIHSRNTNGKFVIQRISGYAERGYSETKYAELIAECFSVATTNETAADILKILRGEVL